MKNRSLSQSSLSTKFILKYHKVVLVKAGQALSFQCDGRLIVTTMKWMNSPELSEIISNGSSLNPIC